MMVEPSPHRAPGTALRLVGAAALVVAGLVHLQLYFDGYRDVPNANLGRSFVLDAIASVLVAIALVARRDLAVRLAGMTVSAAALVAFALSRTDRGVFGFSESGLQPSPQSAIALVAEVSVLLSLGITLLPAVGPGRSVPVRAAASAGAALAAAAVVLSIVWDSGSSTPASAAPATDAVTIAQFAFAPATLTVPAGTTVTWTNADGVAHTVDADDGSFESAALKQGTSFTHTFRAAGTFTYICAIHPSMAGTVVVTG
jgi:plastocyanin